MENVEVRELIVDEEKLAQRSDELDVRKENKLVKSIVLDLKFAMRDYLKNKGTLLALSAPQIGIPKRVVLLNFNGDLRAYVNPMITKAEGLSFNRETLPNFPEKNYLVPRYNSIDVSYQTATGKLGFNTFVGVAAHMMQQQVDLLEGVLISDIGFEVDADFDNATDEEKEEILGLFLESIDVKRAELEKEINENDDLKKMKEGVKFIQSVKSGETKIEPMELNKDKEGEPDNT